MNTALVWSAPTIALSAAAPAMATSPSETPEYGALVVAPWRSSRDIRNWKGNDTLLTKWVYFPTTHPNGAVTLSTNNTEAETFATPGRTGRTAAWPTNFPSGASADPHKYDTTGATYPYPENLSNGVYTDEKVHVNVKVIGGNVTYESYAAEPILSEGMKSATDPGLNTGYYSKNGLQGKGATWPQMDLNDNFKSEGQYYSYLDYQSQIDTNGTWKKSAECYSYGVMSRADNGLPQWDWDTVLMYPVNSGHAGSDAVSFDLRLTPAQFADTAHQSNATAPFSSSSL